MKSLVWLCAWGALVLSWYPAPAAAQLQAGAAIVDVTPLSFPVSVNGGMTANRATRAVTPLHARAIVLDDGQMRVAIVVVDSCMLPRPLLDEAKQLASERTGIRPDHMLISATHTHTAPAAMGCLGTDADPTYVPYLREKLAEAIASAEAHLEPAEVGWASANAAPFTALRRWILRPDRLQADPFGNLTVRANMHAGADLNNVTGESGPEDPELSLIAFRSPAGRPIALLANFSMHYFSGVEALNADYFGLFCQGMERHATGEENDSRPFVAIMSHGCSGDIWRRDYTIAATDPWQSPTIEEYTNGLLAIATAAYDSIQYRDPAHIAMAESRIELKYRVPDKQRLLWAQQVVAQMGDRLPQTTEEVYAREQLILHERQSTEVVVQALRIGDIAIATTPNETYALTGLKIKLQSPIAKTMVIELANGGDGYIPPPEHHGLGGYNTWPARSAGLEVEAEPRITAAALQLLETVAGQPRRAFQQSRGSTAEAILAAKPIAYWRLDDLAAPWAKDISGHECHAFYEPGVVFFLEGPSSDRFCLEGETNRAAHFAGGRLQAQLTQLHDRYSISLWFWNGMPNDAREATGWLFSRDHDHGLSRHGEHLGIGGTATEPGKLIYLAGDAKGTPPSIGRTRIERWTWNHVLFVRDTDHIRVYLNGNPQPEIEQRVTAELPPQLASFFFGGRSDNVANWEGRLDEITVFDRPLAVDEFPALMAN